MCSRIRLLMCTLFHDKLIITKKKNKTVGEVTTNELK